jgi:hypothetical protein
MQLSPMAANPRTGESVGDALVVAPRRQRMVALGLEMRADPLEDRCENNGRDQRPGLPRDSGEIEGRGVEDEELGPGKGLDPVGERAGGVLALEQ